MKQTLKKTRCSEIKNLVSSRLMWTELWNHAACTPPTWFGPVGIQLLCKSQKISWVKAPTEKRSKYWSIDGASVYIYTDYVEKWRQFFIIFVFSLLGQKLSFQSSYIQLSIKIKVTYCFFWLWFWIQNLGNPMKYFKIFTWFFENFIIISHFFRDLKNKIYLSNVRKYLPVYFLDCFLVW